MVLVGIWTEPMKDVHKMAGDARRGNVKFGYYYNSNE